MKNSDKQTDLHSIDTVSKYSEQNKNRNNRQEQNQKLRWRFQDNVSKRKKVSEISWNH